MVHVVIIGGSGHVGSYLVPQLIARGYDVTNVSRGQAKPYISNKAWDKVKNVTIDRKAEEAKGDFGNRIAELKGNVVIDMITFQLDSAKQLVTALKGKVDFYIFCSTIWVGGISTVVPAGEDDLLEPFGDYGIQKAAIEAYLKKEEQGFPWVSFRPGHIVGEGWAPVNPVGNGNLDVWKTISRGEELEMPDAGMTCLHHVHADDCAQWVLCAMDHRDVTIGHCFNNVSSQALTMRGYAEAMYKYFGKTPRLSYKPFEQWKEGRKEEDVEGTRSHMEHSPCASIEKSRKMIGYEPKYTSLQAIQQSVEALKERGMLNLA